MGVKYEECWENTVRAFSLLVFAECGTSHFLALVGDVYVIFEIWRKFSAFPLTPQQSLFFSFWKKPPKISVALTTSDHECQNMLWFLSFFFFLSFSSLYQLLCLVRLLQVPGILLATGKQQDCLLYLVTIATGLECEAIMAALCWAEAGPAAWRDGPSVAPRVCALCPLHLWLFTPGESFLWSTDLLRTWHSIGCRWMTLLAGAAELEGSADFHSLSTYSYFARRILPDFNWSEWCYLGSTCRFIRP